MSRNLHPKKLALLHVAKRQLCLTNEDYRAMLMRIGGVESSADLSESSFLLILDCLRGLGFISSQAKRNFGERAGMATPAQIELMRRLWHEYSGGDDVTLQSWLERFHKISALRFVSAEKAAKIIPALKAMSVRQKHAR